MIDLTKGLPDTILVNGEPILLNTDFRVWIRFQNEIENDKEEIDISYLFQNSIPDIENEVYTQLIDFLVNAPITPKSNGEIGDKVIDYVLDGDYIYSAFYQFYKIDLLDIEYLHWHKFQALCNNINGETCLLGIAKNSRSYKKQSGKYDYDKEQQKMKNAWQLPQSVSQEEKEELEKVKEEFENYFN